MRLNFIPAILGIAAALFLGGCATGRVEADYGTSYNLARFNQTLDPEAGKNLEPVVGMTGQVWEKVAERYQAGFEKPTQAAMPTLVLGAGKK